MPDDILVPPPLVNHEPTPFRSTRGGSEIVMVVIHALSQEIQWQDRYVPAHEWLTTEIPGRAPVSAHATVDPDGRIDVLCPEGEAAWHTGVAAWNELERRSASLNHCSLGVELLVEGQHDYSSFLAALATDWVTAEQYYSLGWLVHDWHSRYPIRYTVGHDEISGDEVRGEGKGKRDPGSGFVWGKMWHQFDRWAGNDRRGKRT